MYTVVYSKNSQKDLEKTDKTTAKKIIQKIMFFSKQENIFNYSKKLKGSDKNTYRFRIGNYRAIFEIDSSGEIQKHRKEIYQ